MAIHKDFPFVCLDTIQPLKICLIFSGGSAILAFWQTAPLKGEIFED
jgi:hypothetical protein